MLENPFKESWILGHLITCLLYNLEIPKELAHLYYLSIALVIDYATIISYINEVHQAQYKHTDVSLILVIEKAKAPH